MILRVLLTNGPSTVDALKREIAEWDVRFDDALASLLKDKLITERDTCFSLPDELRDG